MTKKLDFSISREDCYIETVKLGEQDIIKLEDLKEYIENKIKF